jgi:hypothetical protein
LLSNYIENVLQRKELTDGNIDGQTATKRKTNSRQNGRLIDYRQRKLKDKREGLA